MRANDFVKQKLFDMGMPAEQINTNVANQAIGNWADNTQFQKDLAADTWMNRIKLQDPDLNARAGAIEGLLREGKIQVGDLDTNDLNLMRGAQKEAQVRQADFFVDRAARALYGDKISAGQVNQAELSKINRDLEVNLGRMVNTDNMRRAQALWDGVDEGRLDPKDFDDSDLGLAAAFVHMRQNGIKDAGQALDSVREAKRLDAAQGFLNQRLQGMGLGPVDQQEFTSRYNRSQDKFDQLKQERGVLGAGAFGAVVPGDEGQVLKLQGPANNVWNDGRITPNDALQEANNLEVVRGMGIAPRVDAVDILPDGSTITEMQDLSKNFDSLQKVEDTLTDDQFQRAQIKSFQQQAMANLKGIQLQDRHAGNIMINKLTKSPIQVDFGIVSKLTDTTEQATALGMNAGNAMIAAGLEDEGRMLNGTISALLQAGDKEGAMDVAKQGMALAMKLKGGVNAPSILNPDGVPF